MLQILKGNLRKPNTSESIIGEALSMQNFFEKAFGTYWPVAADRCATGSTHA